MGAIQEASLSIDCKHHYSCNVWRLRSFMSTINEETCTFVMSAEYKVNSDINYIIVTHLFLGVNIQQLEEKTRSTWEQQKATVRCMYHLYHVRYEVW